MTTRRDALKLGALAAAPVAALTPAAVLAGDNSAARLARLEDERAIEGVIKGFIRRFNGSGECGEFVASAAAIRIEAQVCAIREDTSREPQLTHADDGSNAQRQSRVDVDLLTDFDGDSTMEKMARFQGQSSASARASRRLQADLEKTTDGWTIAHLTLA